MAKGFTDDKHYKAIADKVRYYYTDKASKQLSFTPAEMAQAVDNACHDQYRIGRDEGYEAGKAEGGGGDTEAAYQEGLTDGIEQGKSEENRRMWDMIQNYDPDNPDAKTIQAYWGQRWNDETFKPKHTVYADAYTFHFNGSRVCGMTDLRKETVGIDVDWSLCQTFNGLLTNTPVKYLGILDMTNASSATTMLRNSVVETIEEVRLPASTKVDFSTYAFNITTLREVRFTGEFYGSVNFSRSTQLSHESILSILEHLQDLTGTGTTYTLTLGAANLAKITDAEKAIATEKGWTVV